MASQKKDVKLVAGLWLLIAPTALIIATFVLYAIVNFAIGSTDNVSIVRSIMNILLFMVGAISIITWLPGLIIGIILLATRKQ